MTNVRYDPVYCETCGNVIGQSKGHGALPFSLFCLNPLCLLFEPPGIHEGRNAVITALVRDGNPVSTVARKMSLTRQRVYQVVDSYAKGG